MASGQATGQTFVCIRADALGPLIGARYQFASSKRDEVEGEALSCSAAEGKPCTSSQKANEFHLPDGTKYNIADLEDDVLNELVCFPPCFPSTILINEMGHNQLTSHSKQHRISPTQKTRNIENAQQSILL